MKEHEYNEALAMLKAVLNSQPNLFTPTLARAPAGEALADMAWGFIRAYHAQYEKEVQQDGR